MPATTERAAVTIREADRPGDIGFITLMHGRLYAVECGMDQTVEAYIAAGLADFTYRRRQAGDTAGRCWVAEDPDGRIVGSIGITRADEQCLQLRWFLVDSSSRGLGLGRTLLETALDYCRAQAAQQVFLLTIAGLDPAHHLYRAAGFVPTESTPVRQWGVDAVEQRFELALA
jgi:GNAT superfamily N-acetyltransferase